MIQFYANEAGGEKLTQIYIPDLYGAPAAIYVRALWAQERVDGIQLGNWLKTGSSWRKINLADI